MAEKFANNPVPNGRLTRLKGAKSMATTKKKPAKRKPAAARKHNPAPPAANPAKRKRTGAKKRTYNRVTARKATTNRVTKKKGARRHRNGATRNPISAGGAIQFAMAAGTAGLVNAAINYAMALLNLNIPSTGVVGLGAKGLVAWVATWLLPKIKVISPATANLVGVTIFAAAVTNFVSPYLEGFTASFMPAAPAPAAALNDIYRIPDGTWPNGRGPFYPPQPRAALASAPAAARNGMQDIYEIPSRTYPNGFGPFNSGFSPLN